MISLDRDLIEQRFYLFCKRIDAEVDKRNQEYLKNGIHKKLGSSNEDEVAYIFCMDQDHKHVNDISLEIGEYATKKVSDDELIKRLFNHINA